MRLGISSYTFPWSVAAHCLSAQELVQRAVNLGVSVVQIADNLPLDQLSETDLGELDRRSKDLGVRIEVGTRGIAPARLLTYLRLAERFGSPILRTVIDSPGHEPTEEEVVEILSGVLPEFGHAGVVLAIENHDRFRAATLLRILDRLGSSSAGICFDTANSFGCGEGPDAVLDVLAHRVVNLHIKDYAARRLPHNFGFIIEGRPAGQGQLDIPGLLARLRQDGSDLSAILELWPPPDADAAATIASEEAWAAESIRYLRSIWNSVF